MRYLRSAFLFLTLPALAIPYERVHDISVRVFGAKGDGLADDTRAIQNAFDSSCSQRFWISSVTGGGVSPIVITTATPHNFMNGASLTIQSVSGNTNANGEWQALILSSTSIALYGQDGEPSIGKATYTSGGTVAASRTRLYFPAGVYNISSPLVTGCAMFLSGDGPERSIVFQTHQYTLMHGIVANHSLWVQDMAVNTAPLMVDYGMVAVFAGDSTTAPMQGDTFTFLRFQSSGFNFGLDINGSGDKDLLASITVDRCRISVGTKENAISQPINAANALFLTVRNSTLLGDSQPDGAIHNDHAIYTIAVRGVLIENNLIRDHGNSALKLLQGGFHSAACPSIQDYTSWTVRNNRIEGSRMAIAVYSYCALVMPSIVIANNVVWNIPNSYLGDYAAVYIQANCQSNMAQVVSSGNVFTNLGLGGIVLVSQVENDGACDAPAAQGTISNFTSTGDRFVNWSMTSPGTFPAINSSGSNLVHAFISELTAEAGSNGNPQLNLLAFATVN